MHKNPIKGSPSFGQKVFIPQNNEIETENVNKSLETLKNMLSMERVERKLISKLCRFVYLQIN